MDNNNKITPISPSASIPQNELGHTMKEMYRKNKELAEKNKALALLRKIDTIVLSKVTDLEQIAQEVADAIAEDLSFKLVAILLLDKENKSIKRLAVSQSDSIVQAEVKLNQKLFSENIPLTEELNLMVKAVKTRFMQLTHGLNKMLIPHFSEEQSKIAQEIIGINVSFVYPLIVREEVIGVMVLSINDREDHSEFKNELIDRLSSVIGVAIDNALLYQEIQNANLRLRQLDKLKDEFVSLASHELRTPMTVIKSYLWMMLDKNNLETLSEKQKMYIDRAYSSTQRLINLVNDMLNVSRIESGRFTLTMQQIDLVNLINTVYAEMLPKAQEQKMNLEFARPLQNLPKVHADPERVEQVLINLIGNSLKFTPENGTIRLSIDYDPNEQQEIVSVIDSGKGIAKGDVPKLFQKFSMIGSNYFVKQNTQGTGLGLYLSKSIIELMGGKIWVESEGEGKGSKFSFTLKTV
jgi:signal transduction histidine kinase